MTFFSKIDKANSVFLTALDRLAAVSDWPETELNFRRALVARHHKRRRRLHLQIACGDTRAIRFQERVLDSYAGRLCAWLEEVVPAGKASFPEPMPIKALDALLKDCRPMRRVFECAKLHVQTKANGDKRRVISPGRKVRVAQRLVGHVLQAWPVTNPYEYNQRGRGRNAAVKNLIHLIEERELRHLVLFDVENFFASVKPSHLSWHPLPRQVMQHSVFFNRNAILLHDKGHGAEAKSARHGLPQGARLSGDIASSLLGRELCSLSGEKGTVTYVDDGVIGACDPAGAKDLAKALEMRFTNHSGGPLSFKHLTIIDVAEGFSFLGYWIRLIWADDKVQVVVRPSHEAKVRLKRGIFTRLKKIGAELDFDQAVKLAGEYGVRWRHSYSLWHPDEVALLEFEAEVDTYVDDFFCGYAKKIPLKVHPLLGGGTH